MSASSARRTISGANRARKSGPRHPCGKLVQRSTQEREADIIALVLKQPHRNGSLDQKTATLIGRLVSVKPVAVSVEGFTPRQLYDLAERFLRDYQRFQAALASRHPLAVTGGGALPPEPDPVAEQRAVDQWAFVCRCLRVHGERIERAMIAAVVDAAPDMDQRILAPWIVLSLPLGFRALAEAYS